MGRSLILTIKSYVIEKGIIKCIIHVHGLLPVFKIEIVFERKEMEKRKRYLFRIMKQKEMGTHLCFLC